jgi:cell wall-associated NlpC family hydrolase
MPRQSQGIVFLGFLMSGVFIYAAVTDNNVFAVLTGKATSGPGQGDVDSGDTAQPTGGTTDDPTESDNVAVSGVRGAVVSAAEGALGDNGSYRETRPYPESLADAKTAGTDCSGFVTLCYKEGGARDPNGMGYSGYGFTGTLIARGKKTGNPQPADLHFWSGPAHVAIDVGNGQIIEWGNPAGGNPIKTSLQDEMGFHTGYLGARTYLPLSEDTNLATGNNPRGTSVDNG